MHPAQQRPSSEAIRQHLAHRERLRRMEARAYHPPVQEPAPFVSATQQTRQAAQAPVFTRRIEPTRPRAVRAATPCAADDVSERIPTMAEILFEVCAYFSISKNSILSRRRTRLVIRPRMICYWLIRTHTRHTFPEMGRFMGNRDHTSVLSGYWKIEEARHSDDRTAADIQRIQIKLGVCHAEGLR